MHTDRQNCIASGQSGYGRKLRHLLKFGFERSTKILDVRIGKCLATRSHPSAGYANLIIAQRKSDSQLVSHLSTTNFDDAALQEPVSAPAA